MFDQHARRTTVPDSPGRGGRSVGRSLRGRIVVGMFAAGLVPMTVMTYQGYHCARSAIVESKTAHLAAVLDLRSLAFEAWLAERQSDLLTLASDPCMLGCCCGTDPQRQAAEAACRTIDKLRSHQPSFAKVLVFGADWRKLDLQQGNHDSDAITTLTDAFRLRLADAREPVVSPTHEHADGWIGLYIGHAVRGDTDGAPLGYVVGVVDLSGGLGSLLTRREDLGRTGQLYIVSPAGSFLVPPGGSAGLRGEQATLPPQMLAASPRPAVMQYRNLSGDLVLGGAARIPHLDWILVVEKSQTEVFGWLDRLKLRALVTAAVTAFLVFLLCLRHAEAVAAPFRVLAAAARRVGSGETGHRVGELGAAEAAEVARAFDQMLDELAAKQGELADAAALAAVGKLSSAIVHEMRTPLGSVKLGLEAFAEMAADDPDYSELAQIAITQTERLQRMLNDLLAYAKPLSLDLQHVSLQSLLEETVRLSGPSAGQEDVELVIDCDGTGDRIVRIDKEQMLRALGNLVLNAVQASSRGGRVVVAVRSVDATAREIAVTVSDGGPGIPASVLETVFDPFVTTREGGTGLGLATARKIVHAHGGRITGENAPGGGAVFTVFLPLSGVDP